MIIQIKGKFYDLAGNEVDPPTKKYVRWAL